MSHEDIFPHVCRVSPSIITSHQQHWIVQYGAGKFRVGGHFGY